MADNNLVPLFMASMKDAATSSDSTGAKQSISKEETKAYWAKKDMDAINKGNLNTKPIDTNTVKMAHTDWLAHLDKIGYQVVPKPKQ